MANPPCTMRVLVLTTEPLPLPGCVTTGAGLRAWGLAEGLRSRGFDVVIASPALHEGGADPATHLPPHVRACPRSDLGALVADVKPAVVVLQHWGLAADMPELPVPLALDLAGPHLLERLYWGDADIERNVAEKIAALRRADFVTCSGEYQRHYFYPFLAMAGFDLRKTLVPIIPFSVPPDAGSSNPASRDPLAFVYGGAFLAWQDPSGPIRWLLEELERAGRGTLHFFGGGHPVADASGGRFAELTAALREHPRAVVRGLVAFEDLLTAYRGASVALDLMARNPERELAFTTRTMIYLYCGLPVMHNDYSEVGRLVRERGCGWSLDPDDEAGVRRAVRSVLDGSAPLEAMRRAARATASDYSWDKTIGPLADFCANPRQREGRLAIVLAAQARRRELEAIRDERDALRSELLSIKGRLSYRLLQRLPAFGVVLAPFVYLAGWVLAAAVYLRLRRTNH